MANITYSKEALNNLKYFHRKKHVIYVEGQDDVPFWSDILKHFQLDNYIIKIAGGDKEVEKYAKLIMDFDTDIIVAKDCDYSDLLQTQLCHKRILYTFGYSIENTLYRARSIAAAIASHARIEKDEDLINEAQIWLNSLGEKFKRMILLDLANTWFNKGIKVIPNTCHQFIVQASQISICDDKIGEVCTNVESSFEEEEIEHCIQLLNKSDKNLFFRLRGHFVTNAIVKFIEQYVRKTRSSFRLPDEHLYALMMSELLKNYGEEVDIEYLGMQIKGLSSSAA